MAKNEKSKDTAVAKSHRKANIAVIIVVSIAALILITIAVLSLVKVDPVSEIEQPVTYNFYTENASLPEGTGDSASQSKIRTALSDMKFTVMSALLRWNWDYTYNFKRNAAGAKIELSAKDVQNITAGSGEYMVEYVYDDIKYNGDIEDLDYSNAKSIKVDGETVYFDRIKMIISNTDGEVGLLTFYPYINARLDNQSDIDSVASDKYKVTGINVRANTTDCFSALKALADEQ